MILEQVRRAVTRHGMLAPGELVLVAVSGGPDSVALAHALHLLAPELGVRLHLFHLDHGLRGEAGAADARWVAEFAARRGLPFTVRQAHVAAEAARHGGVEAAGRAVRYRELQRVAAATGARRVAVGHNRDDQAETLLLRLLRGAGRRGLGGMAPVRPLGPGSAPGTTLIRPLLAIARAEIEAFCAAEQLDPRTDPTNAEPLYARNRIRLELLPFLRERFNPQVAARLADTAAVLRAEDDYLDAAAQAALAGLGLPPGQVPAAALLGVHPALRRRMVRILAGQAGVALDLGHVEAILDLCTTTGTTATSLPGGWQAVAEYGLLTFLSPGPGAAATAAPVPLPVPGQVDALGWRFTAALAPAPDGTGAPAGVHPEAGDRALALELDPARLPGALAVRTWRPGDRLYPVGMTGSKKLQDLFVDLKVPRTRRGRVPLLVAGDAVLWAVGLRSDRRFAPAPGTPCVRILATPPAPAAASDQNSPWRAQP